jgi:hypothetical protein
MPPLRLHVSPGLDQFLDRYQGDAKQLFPSRYSFHAPSSRFEVKRVRNRFSSR